MMNSEHSSKDNSTDWPTNHYRLKYITTMNDDVLPETTDPERSVQYIEIGDVKYNEGIVASTEYTFETAPSRARRLVRNGDTIISTVRTYLKAVAPIKNPDTDLVVSTGFAVVRPNQKVLHSEYAGYLFLSDKILNEIVSRSVGVSYPAVRPEDIANIPVFLPTIPFQKSVASFLNAETSRIDALISKKERQIELLQEKRQAIITRAVTKGLDPTAQMKDSGSILVGEIPSHWRLRKLKALTSLITKGTTPNTIGHEILESGPIRFLKAENLTSDGNIADKPSFYISEDTQRSLSRSIILDGDVLFVIAGATIGKVALVSSSFLPANTNQAVCIIRSVSTTHRKLLLHYLQSLVVRRIIDLNSVQSAQPNLAMEDIGNLPVPLPPEGELTAISSHLEANNDLIDRTTSFVSKSLSLLHEFRSSLITAAVSGQIDLSKMELKTPV